MRVVRWSQAERVIPQEDQDDFFARPIDGPVLYSFWTRRLSIAPHAGAFSLKLVLDGAEAYHFGRRSRVVRGGEFMLVPAGETYGSDIVSSTRSASIFLMPERAQDLWSAAGGQGEPEPLPASLRLNLAARVAWRMLDAVDDPDAADEAATALLLACVEDQVRQVERAPVAAVRSATRAELLSRVARARDLIHDLNGHDCGLERLAEAACLSKYHFLRVFKAAVGATPAAYARRVRAGAV